MVAKAQTTTWNGVNAWLRLNVFTRGEYPQLNNITIKMHPDSIDCYFTDIKAFNSKLNGEDVTPITYYKDENGYVKEFYFPLENLVKGENKFTYKRQVPYINKSDETQQIRLSHSTSTTYYIYINITPYTTFASADAISEEGLESHSKIVTYPFGNEPGEYNYLLGEYAFNLNNRYNRYNRDLDEQIRPYVMDGDGNFVAFCTNRIDRSQTYKDSDVTFHVGIDQPITTPGEYWIVYPSSGIYRYLTSAGSNNFLHFSNFKIGPYIIKERTTGTPLSVEAQYEWLDEPTFSSDHLPDSLHLMITNAKTLGCHKTRPAQNTFKTIISFSDIDLPVANIATSGLQTFAIALPNGWYQGTGEYKLTIDSPADIFEGFAADGAPIAFSNDEPLSTTFTVSDPELPEALDFYVRSAGATDYEIADGESVNVRLMHGDQALGLKIFVRWTPETVSYTPLTLPTICSV